MALVHVIANLKGGVGKTTVTVQLAAVVADAMGGTPDDTPVLGVSVDPQASMFEWATRVGDALPFDFEQCDNDPEALAKMKAHAPYEHIFVDTPGSLNDTDVLTAVLKQADDIIIPILPEVMSFSPAEQTIRFIEQATSSPWRILINNWMPGRHEADLEQTRAYLDAKRWPSFHVSIRNYRLHARASAERMTVVQYANNRVAREARTDFLNLGLEVLGRNRAGASRHSKGADEAKDGSF
jgi:chromosome partitioning protein